MEGEMWGPVRCNEQCVSKPRAKESPPTSITAHR